MEIVLFEIAQKLKEKGFNEDCHAYYEPLKHCLNFSRVFKTNSLAENYKCVMAPTISQVLKWLREEKKIFVTINIGYCYDSDEIPFLTNPNLEPILKGYYYGIWELDNLNDKNGHSEYFETPE